MIVERTDSGMTRITRGDGTSFEYMSACACVGDWRYDAGAREIEVIEDTCRTLLTGGHFYPEGFKWMRDNWGVAFEGGKLWLHPAVFDFAQAAFEGE